MATSLYVYKYLTLRIVPCRGVTELVEYGVIAHGCGHLLISLVLLNVRRGQAHVDHAVIVTHFKQRLSKADTVKW